MIVEVVSLPAMVQDVERKLAIVVDALRASSTIVALFEAGAASVTVAADPADAFALASGHRERYLLCGEQGGVTVPGFDCGNSPRQVVDLALGGRSVVLSTSNGTRALRAVAHSPVVLVGTGRNATSLASFALTEAERRQLDLVIVCAGDEQGSLFSLEDLFFAGCLVERLLAQRPFSWPVDESDPGSGDPRRWVLDESGVAARRLFRSYASQPGAEPSPDDVLAMFRDARNGRTLPRIGYGADLAYCAQIDCSAVVPRLRAQDGCFVLVA